MRNRASAIGRSFALMAALGVALPAGAVQVELVSKVPPVRASGTASGTSEASALSADGRWLVFTSDAPNLIPGQVDGNNGKDVFLHDRITGETVLVSRRDGEETTAAGGNGASLSADGRYVAFFSEGADLIPGQQDTPGTFDVFLYDRVTGAMELVSRRRGRRTEAAGLSHTPTVSADGRWVAFVSSATDLVTGQFTGPFLNVFLWERRTGALRLVSRSAASATRAGNSSSQTPALSADGRYTVFTSFATDLVPGQTDVGSSSADAFLFDRVSGKTTLVSRTAASPTVAANSSVPGPPRISADGRFVVYVSRATNLVPGQSTPRDSIANVFLFERATGKTWLVSRSAASPTATGDENSTSSFVSADGSFVVFGSEASNLVPGQAAVPGSPEGVFLYTRATGRVSLVSGAGGSATTTANGNSIPAGISRDGGTILLVSAATDLAPGVADANQRGDVFLWDRSSGRAALVSHGPASPTTAADKGSFGSSLLSADGRWIAFTSEATDLDAGVRDTNGFTEVVLQERTGGRELVTRRDPARPSATSPALSSGASVSADGRYVAFASRSADLLPGRRDANGTWDVFLYDRVARTFTLVSRSAASPLIPASSAATAPRISADGRWVVYESAASDVVPGQVETAASLDVFLWDRDTGATVLVSHAAGSPLTGAGGGGAVVSADGSAVVFLSTGDNLVPGQVEQDADPDLFLWERATGVTHLVSRAAGSAATSANARASLPGLSADGRFVAFVSRATNLVAGVTDTNDGDDVFVFDRITGVNTLASRTAASPTVAAGGGSPVLSGDGRSVGFFSTSGDLVPGQVPPSGGRARSNLFLHDRQTGVTRLVTHTAASPTAEAGGFVYIGNLSADGRFFVHTNAGDLLPGQVLNRSEVFVYDRETGLNELVSRTPSGAPATANGGVLPAISADGRIVAFLSDAGDLLPGGSGRLPTFNLFVYDRQTRTTSLASRAHSGAGIPADRDCEEYALSADGAWLVFWTDAGNLAPNDFNKLEDVFLAGVR